MRAILIALCGLMLTACNMVSSKEPLFAKADEAGAAPLRDGWWVSPKTDDGPCAYDLKADARDWPECAAAQLILGGRLIDTEKGEAPQDFVLAAGEPRIMQIDIKEKGQVVYGYGAVRPTQTGKDGRMTAFVSWMVQCGPPPPEPKEAKGMADYATRHPVAGLQIDKETGGCWATKPEQVREAAKASEAWAKPKDRKEVRWAGAMAPGEDKAKPKPPEPAESPASDDPDKMR